MTCLKCGGVMTDERVSDLFDPCRLWRCIQCGLMLDWMILKNREASKAGGVEMPNFRSEEHRRNWIESIRRAKAKNRPQAEPAQQPVSVTPAAALPEATTTAHREVLAAIELTLAQLARDRAALERAKEILSR